MPVATDPHRRRQKRTPGSQFLAIYGLWSRRALSLWQPSFLSYWVNKLSHLQLQLTV